MVEHNMCNAAMRGIVVPPGSKTTFWPVRRKLADQFYRRFFELAPDAQGLFRGDMESSTSN